MITVEQVLANNNIHFKTGETKYSIRCLSPEHEDRHPSMAVTKPQEMLSASPAVTRLMCTNCSVFKSAKPILRL